MYFLELPVSATDSSSRSILEIENPALDGFAGFFNRIRREAVMQANSDLTLLNNQV
jgi:hypothetical protein